MPCVPSTKRPSCPDDLGPPNPGVEGFAERGASTCYEAGEQVPRFAGLSLLCNSLARSLNHEGMPDSPGLSCYCESRGGTAPRLRFAARGTRNQ